jgi:hypothetical protein
VQESHGLHRKWLTKRIKEGNKRVSTIKNEQLQKTEEGICKEPQKRPRRDTLGIYKVVQILPGLICV